MPSVHTHSESFRDREKAQPGCAQVRLQRVCNRPVSWTPQEHLCSFPQELSHAVTDTSQDTADWGCFKVLWEICRDRSFLFHSVMEQRGEHHPTPTEQLSLPSTWTQPAPLFLPGISLLLCCMCRLLRNKKEQGGSAFKEAGHAHAGKHSLPSLWEPSEMEVPQESHMAVLLVCVVCC